MSGLENYRDTYEILEKIGEGGGGIVYKAYHKRLKMDVVLKKIRGKNISRIMQRREADILKKLNHAYLPQVYDFLPTDEGVYTVMSYVPGISLQEALEHRMEFPFHRLIRWGMQLCSALNYLHSQNPPIIHGDIKPANIMLKPDGDICLIDFNISFFLDSEIVPGYSPGYTSPEQYILALKSQSSHEIADPSSIDQRTDIYSVGSTLYYLATGTKKRDYQEPIDQEYLADCTSDAFAQVIVRAMQINPDNRYQDAYEMFQALQGITKRDERYRSLLRRQRWGRAVIVLLLAGFIVLGGYGVHQMKLEKTDAYNRLVDQQIDAREEKDYDREEECYLEASKLMPESLEAYYQRAYTLYEQEDYQECIEFIDYDILKNEKLDLRQEHMSDVYYLKADSAFYLEQYEDAVEAYQALFSCGGAKTFHYRDYAITLAYSGDQEKAEEVLDEAVEKGLEEDSVYYARGEIEKELGQYDRAVSDFESCLDCSDDGALMARAYLMISRIYRENGEAEEEQEILEEAVRMLPARNQLLVLERLIQVNMDLADSTGEEHYRDEAIDGLLTVIDQGWDTFDTYDNLVVLYEKQGDLEEAEEQLAGMEEKFGENYRIYKRYAFLEIDRQEQKENRYRDYSKFAEYYDQAMTLYDQVNAEDEEMMLLQQVYEQVKEGNWL